MDFTNDTPFPADLQRGSTGEKEMVAIAGCKVTYLLEDDGLRAVTGEPAWPLFDQPFEFRETTLMPELDFRKRDIDLLVFGTARAPGDEPVRWMEVSVECGEIQKRIMVFGDRLWHDSGPGFVASEPAPFTEMPLTNDRAFGGEARLEGATVRHPVNPDGRGLVYSESEVEGTRLPNLEDPDELIQDWTDTPRPACLLPPAGTYPSRSDSSEDPEEMLEAALDGVFNQAVPELVARPDQLGETLVLRGFSSEGGVAFPMPDLEGPSVHVEVGDEVDRFPARLSTLVALADERVLIATYLALFRYLVRPEELRETVVRWPDAPELSTEVEASGSEEHD